jgi:hypothetical protein
VGSVPLDHSTIGLQAHSCLVLSLVNQILGYKEEVDAVDTSWRGEWEPAPRSKTTQEGRSKGAAPKSTLEPGRSGAQRGTSSTSGVDMVVVEDLEGVVLFY